jgi:CHAD domain-containing protein
MNRARARVTTTLLERRARALKRHLKAAIDGDVTGVHQARVASRRLREAVPVLATGLKGSKAGKARNKIRRLTRALGTVRESDVTIALLDELAARDTLPRLALEEVRRHAMEEAERRRETMLKRLEGVNIDKLDRRLAAVGQALAQAETEGWRQVLASRLLKRTKALKSAMGDAGRIYNPEHLHQVRIASKKLRYTMEMAAETGATHARRLVTLLKRTQDTLGRLHDLQVLQGHVGAVQAAPVGRSIPDTGLDLIGRALEDECRHLHGRYVATLPALAELTEATRTAIVPQIARSRAARARTAKMALSAKPNRRGRDAAPAAGAQG